MTGEKATIVTYPDEFSIQEVKELAKAAGYTIAEVVTQRKVVKSEYGVGVGKAEELRDMVSRNGSKVLIVDAELTSSQAFKLATVARVEIVDRDRLILNIFARRAMTTEAKLQVQLAELRYEMPRARDAVRYSVNGERAGFMGMGETMVDVKFRALKKRMNFIKERLARARTSRGLHRTERRKLGLPFVSLAGYTSSGKTTLFNKLASESREESPGLFTTLTTTMRAVAFTDPKKRVMLSDTVGFISRIPTYMVESFKSTLEELTYADLVLLLLDASEDRENMAIKLGSCRDTLGQLGVDPKKVILVLNKIDRLQGEAVRDLEGDELFAGFEVLKISAVRGDGMRQLKNRIMAATYPAGQRQAPAPVPTRMEFSR
ncbi:MAG: GTPase HflX [Nitrososphaerota archaeon]|nr:GTPase HflX [Nitrososphaerota archaeon]MDG6978259.1 GTPase HflX [Nitrososphaerota archaeon]MDG7005401.1 GTPase HflX [Nitrososphaerota archaeon]MDG7021523.1 GTPase HflX [Nitrososphaerota archaeon]MDG7022364.1 GTPase HflX [Nitrososphaerota archaeon]